MGFWDGRPEMILFERDGWRVIQEFKPAEMAFYGYWPWWGVGQSPVVIQHLHQTSTGDKWQTASQLILKVDVELPNNTTKYFNLDEDEQIEQWKQEGEWRKDCRVCGAPIPEHVRCIFDYFREHLTHE